MFDHIHLYASLPSTISIADFVNAVKSNSSHWVHESFATRKGFAWQEGYGAFSVSKSEEPKVIRYIRNQHRHHAKQSLRMSSSSSLCEMKLSTTKSIYG